MDLSPRELETNFQIIKFLLENGVTIIDINIIKGKKRLALCKE
jgi:hypothetical protein